MMMARKFILTVLVFGSLFFTSCQAQEVIVETPEPAFSTPTNKEIDPPVPTSTPTIESFATKTAACFPLAGLVFSDLSAAEININPFATPAVSLDDGHHGLDIAFWHFEDFSTMEGLPVLSMFDGKVVSVINDRAPYGNMIMIETPLDQIPAEFMESGYIPTRAPLAVNDGRLTCPEFSGAEYESNARSLYVLYAHLLNPPTFRTGDSVTACQQIGAVGNTGESSQFHLHMEVRVGPSGASFPCMSHRNTGATVEEMRNYCLWRISGIFQMFDPMTVLSQIP